MKVSILISLETYSKLECIALHLFGHKYPVMGYFDINSVDLTLQNHLVVPFTEAIRYLDIDKT